MIFVLAPFWGGAAKSTHQIQTPRLWISGVDKGYDWCHKFATAVIVGKNTHYIVGVCPLGSTEYADTDAYAGDDKSYYMGDVARRLLSIAEKYVNIRTVYADREFHAVDVIHTLEDSSA